jgi:hypothetical protein
MSRAGAVAASEASGPSLQQAPSDLLEVISKVSSRDTLDRHVSKLVVCLENNAAALPAASAELIALYGGGSHTQGSSFKGLACTT